MSKKLILPTVIRTENLESDAYKLIYILNRWLNTIERYGKLEYGQEDFRVLARIIKSDDKRLRRAAATCRDYALSERVSIEALCCCLRDTLYMLQDQHDTEHIRKVKKVSDDLGMTEKYSHLSRRLAKEKIRKLGKTVLFTDERTDDSRTSRLVRRFIEKRAAQAVHRMARNGEMDSIRFRQSVRRAVSFSLYKKSYVDYEGELRTSGTHWKKARVGCGQRRLVAKTSYISYEEAVAACERHARNHPEDPRPMSPYVCAHCGKWHIGHDRTLVTYHDIQGLMEPGSCEAC